MDEIENPDRWEQFLQFWKEDIYLQLSAYGVAVFVVLCVFIVLCWSHYGTAVSSVIDPKTGKASTKPPISTEDCEGTPRSPSSRHIKETFVLSPETSKIEQATKKRQ